MPDVVIAGGGVAGASLAIHLGRAGYRVALFDKARFPRDKACGEGLMPSGVAALARLGFEPEGAPFYGVRYHADGVTATGRFPAIAGHPAHGLGQRRLALDHRLMEAARATAGVEVFEGMKVDRPLVEDGRVIGVEVDGKPVLAPLTVGADGLHSPTRRQLGLDRPLPTHRRLGLRRHFRLPADPGEFVEVFLTPTGAEVYTTPLPNRELLVAVLYHADSNPGSPATTFDALVDAQPALARRLEGAEPLSPLLGAGPFDVGPRDEILPGLVLVGDAAGFIDPITGGGMAQALLTAELLAARAADLIEQGEPKHFRRFEVERARLLRDYRLLTRGVLMLSRQPFLSAAVIRTLDRFPFCFNYLLGVSSGLSRLPLP